MTTKVAIASATVQTFLTILVGRITRYDAMLAKKEESRPHGRVNIYRLGLLLEAAHKVEDEMSSFLKRDDAEAMAALRKSVSRNFTTGFPPSTQVLKLIDAWDKEKKFPKYASTADRVLVRFLQAGRTPLVAERVVDRFLRNRG